MISLKKLALNVLYSNSLGYISPEIITNICERQPEGITYMIRVLRVVVNKHLKNNVPQKGKISFKYAKTFLDIVPSHLHPWFFADFGPAEDKILLTKEDRKQFQKMEDERRKSQDVILGILNVPVKKIKLARVNPAQYLINEIEWKNNYKKIKQIREKQENDDWEYILKNWQLAKQHACPWWEFNPKNGICEYANKTETCDVTTANIF